MCWVGEQKWGFKRFFFLIFGFEGKLSMKEKLLYELITFELN